MPGVDEEDRDEEAVADRVELASSDIDVAGRPAAQHDAGEEGAEDDVEAESVGQTAGPAAARRCCGAWSGRSRAPRAGCRASPPPARTSAACSSTSARGDRGERDREPRACLLPRNTAIARIGKSSPTAPAANKYRPNRPPSMPLVPQDRQQRPSAVVVSASATGANAWTTPAASSAPTPTSASTTRRAKPMSASRPGAGRTAQVELVAREQEQEPEPHVGEICTSPGRPSRALAVRPMPADQQQHDLRDQRPRHQREDQRRQQGHSSDSYEGADPDGAVHAPPPPPASIVRLRPRRGSRILPTASGRVQGRPSRFRAIVIEPADRQGPRAEPGSTASTIGTGER